MRCKPGDLAYVVRSNCGNEGRVVTVEYWVQQGHRFGKFASSVDGWLCTGSLRDSKGGKLSDGVYPDTWLFPLIDNDGEDEMLGIIRPPRKEVS